MGAINGILMGVYAVVYLAEPMAIFKIKLAKIHYYEDLIK